MAIKEDWERFEKTVSILERQISENASVKRNQHLPVLGSQSGRTRQCDVVIEEGIAPRRTISIVEVQKRASKPSINEFNGWVEKLKEVGAQHLICVSDAGFPQSIKEKAQQLGPTVRLITLRKIEGKPWPLPRTFFQQKMETVRYDRLNGLQMEGEHVMRLNPLNPHPKHPPNPHEKIFKLSDGKLISPTDLLDWHFFSTPSNLASLPKHTQVTVGVNFQWGWNQGLQYKDFGENWVYLKRLLLSISLYIYDVDMEWEGRAYEQLGWGELGWALRGHSEVSGKRLELIAPLVCSAPGEYFLKTPIVLGDHDAFFSIGEKGYKAENYSDMDS